MKTILFSLLALSILLPTVYAQETLPDLIEVERQGLMPEGIEYDTQGERFLLGSLSGGTIFAVTDDGTITPFIEDADLHSSVGIEIDEDNHRLLVCNSMAEVFSENSLQGEISLAAYDLETGERLFLVDLTALYPEGRHFANDVAVDTEGNAYVTDTMSPVIYKVTPEGEASIFLEDDRFAVSPFGLNGIVFHPDGYLLVSEMGAATIYKIPLDDPASLSEVGLEDFIIADGMVLHPNGDLIAVNGATGEIEALRSEDDFATAQRVAFSPDHSPATTIAVRGEEIYASHAYLNNTEQAVYDIVRVEFSEP